MPAVPLICLQQTRYVSNDQKARDLNQEGVHEELSEVDDALEAEKEKQVRKPWHREGADQAPVSRSRSAGAMTKGNIVVNSVGQKLIFGRQAPDDTI